jgi:bifunctional non-homologous end joining protein LigD
MVIKTRKYTRSGKLPAVSGHRRRGERLSQDPLRQILNAATPAIPGFVEPMKCKLVNALPAGDWVYELKFDGFRAVAVKLGSSATLISRNRKDLSERFPELIQSVRKLKLKSGVLDGEIVVLDDSGRPSFQALQNIGEDPAVRARLFYFVFDIINFEGRDLRQLPLDDRKYVLESLAKGGVPRIRIVQAQRTTPEAVIAKVEEQGLEGLIAKKRLSRYEAGQRSGSWLKYKNLHSQEFVIGGYTLPEGSREHFGSLVVGYYEHDKLFYASKVGTGFTPRQLEILHGKMKPLAQVECPFANLPERRSGRWGQGLTATEMKRCAWVKPVLVGEVAFTEWTEGDHLRHPSFKGLREDKTAREVRREK